MRGLMALSWRGEVEPDEPTKAPVDKVSFYGGPLDGVSMDPRPQGLRACLGSTIRIPGESGSYFVSRVDNDTHGYAQWRLASCPK